MKQLAGLLMCLLSPVIVRAANSEGEIRDIDSTANTVNDASGVTLHKYRVRPDTEIQINGVRANFGDLAAGMEVKVVSGDPVLASKLVAIGKPNLTPNSLPAMKAMAKQMDDFEQSLKDSKWITGDKGDKSFTLHANGKASTSWQEHSNPWKVISPTLVDVHLAWAADKPPVRMTISADGEEGTSRRRTKIANRDIVALVLTKEILGAV